MKIYTPTPRTFKPRKDVITFIYDADKERRMAGIRRVNYLLGNFEHCNCGKCRPETSGL